MSEIKKQFIQAIRAQDVELSEDLYRRIPEIQSVGELNGFFHGILAQHKHCTLDLRSSLVADENFNSWLTNFKANVLPHIIESRLPTCTDKAATPAYACVSSCL
ncbi:hypothetical protein PHABIO_222 [Pseudomonas phage Phabio]|uniref:Uncharacterized protein n=1 Tax=Pseudomonas phage Phabio TaxID=2006668 RepID=A0A1Y0SYM3_9CAUD|nr:hypothetical protein MZD05_gp222 [Pseudomonas phage Phabio]ARV76853.1 hypothetical protein PHABIO_222 [Pseudomonas phage Phabio]